MDEYEIASRGGFDGVEFGLHNGEEVVVDHATFYYYLQKSCDVYLSEYPQDKEVITSLLQKVKDRFDI